MSYCRLWVGEWVGGLGGNGVGVEETHCFL